MCHYLTGSLFYKQNLWHNCIVTMETDVCGILPSPPPSLSYHLSQQNMQLQTHDNDEIFPEKL